MIKSVPVKNKRHISVCAFIFYVKDLPDESDKIMSIDKCPRLKCNRNLRTALILETAVLNRTR